MTSEGHPSVDRTDQETSSSVTSDSPKIDDETSKDFQEFPTKAESCQDL